MTQYSPLQNIVLTYTSILSQPVHRHVQSAELNSQAVAQHSSHFRTSARRVGQARLSKADDVIQPLRNVHANRLALHIYTEY
jgi:hypothetical protein